MGTRKDPSISSRDAEPAESDHAEEPSESTAPPAEKAGKGGGLIAGCESIAGMKPGWLYRHQDRAILHRPTADARPRQIGVVPKVVGRVVHLTDDGQDIRSEYLVLGKRQRRPRILTEDELDRGTWAAKTGNRRPTGNDERHAFARLIREAGDKAEEVYARTHFNDAGDLILPDGHAQTLGYRTLRGDQEKARQAWREIGSWMTKDGKAALVAGAFFAGPVLDSLDMLAHMVSVYGTGQLGKSTILTVCAATCGDVRPKGQQLMMAWNSSRQGHTQGLRQRGHLPVAFDEHSSSGRSIRDSSREISQMVAGAIRAMGSADGSPRESDGFWHSCILSSSNEPLKFDGQTEDLASRLQEFQCPIFPNVMVTSDGRQAEPGHPRAEHLSKRLKRLAREHGGWPLEWAVDAGTYRAGNLDTLRDRHMELCAKYRQAQGGIAATIAELHMAWVVGAHMLGTVIGVPEIAEVAEAEAAARLADAIEIAEEANVPDHEKLWNELDALRIEAGAFPEMEQLPIVAAESLRAPKGFHRSDAGEWWVVDPVVRAAADRAEIDNLTAALRALHSLGVHIRGDGKHSQRQTPRELVREEKLPRRMHCFNLRKAAEHFTSDDTPDGPAPTEFPRVPTPEGGGWVQGVGTENTPLTCTAPTAPTAPTRFPEDSCTRESAPPGQDAAPPVPNGALMIGPNGPVLALDGWAPCRGCGANAPYRDDLGPVHPGGNCWEPRADVESAVTAAESAPEWPEVPQPPDDPIGVPEPRSAPDVIEVTPDRTRRRHVVAALTTSGLWVAGEDAPRPVAEMPTTRAGCIELALTHGVDRLFVYPDVTAGADLPESIDPARPPVTHPWADLTGTPFTSAPDAADDVLRPYSVVRRRDDSRTVVLALVRLDPVWEDVETRRLPSPADLAAGHAQFNRQFKTWWFVSEPHMFRSLLERAIDRTTHADRIERVESVATLQIPAMRQTSLMDRDSRPLTAVEDGMTFLTGLDRNSAWPTAMTGTRVGIGEPRHVTDPFTYDPAKYGQNAAYLRIDHDVWIDPHIDDLLHLGAGWLTTGEARMLARGIDDPRDKSKKLLKPIELHIAEAWIWDDSPELFQGFGREIRKARHAFIAQLPNPGAEVALTLLKAMANAFGALSPGISAPPSEAATTERGRLWRPDWHDQLKGQGQANIMREVLTAGLLHGRWPMAVNVDEMVYATNHADPAETARELGLTYDPTGAAGDGWKAKGPVSVKAAAHIAGESNFWPLFNKLRTEGK